MMIYALDQKNQLVHVDSVPNGLKCNCHCPSCGEELSARQGRKKQHSFAHASKSEVKCAYGYQTSLHLLAKEIFNEGCDLLLPSVYYNEEKLDYSMFDEETREEVHKPIFNSQTIRADSVELEKQYDNFIPDIILYYKETPLVVEIFVTHPVDDEKKEKIINSGVSAIEFDLSKMDREIDKDSLKRIFESGEYCHWIYNERGNEKTKKFMETLKRRQEQKFKEKKELIEKFGSETKRYKIYWNSMKDSYIIYNPPCQKYTSYIRNESGEHVHIKKIGYCAQCPFFCGFKAKDNSYLLGSYEYLFCKLTPGKEWRK